MYIQSYKELIVWQKSVILVKEVYLATEKFPKSEIYGLTSQLRRAVISVPSNIAEGYGRRSKKEFSHFCAIAYGSALEVETQIILCKELNFLKPEDSRTLEEVLGEVLKMLNSMIAKIKN